MDWFFENLGKFVTFIIFLVYIFSSLKGRGAAEEEEDPEALERARKIQEEIRRRILERQQGAQPIEEAEAEAEALAQDEWGRSESPSPRYDPTVPETEQRGWAPPPIFQREQRPAPKPLPEIVFEEPEEDIYEMQRRQIAEQMAKADALRQKIGLGKAAPIAVELHTSKSVDASAATGRLAQRLHRGLSDRDSLRTAVLLKEVLDKPVGLR